MKVIAPLALAAGMAATLASAQVYPNPREDNPDWNTRDNWCVQQRDVCPAICQDQAFVGAAQNECDPETLAYVCICEDGRSPNLTEYSITIPFNICQWSKQECVNNCKGEATCSDLCFTKKQCGATNPRGVNITTTTGLPSQTATGTASPSGTDEPEDKFDSMGNTVREFASVYGVGVMVVGMVAGFWGML